MHRFPVWTAGKLHQNGFEPRPERVPAILHRRMPEFEAFGYFFSSKIQDIVVMA